MMCVLFWFCFNNGVSTPNGETFPLISNNFQGYVSVFFLHLGVSLSGGEAVNKSYSMSGALSQCWNVAEKTSPPKAM